MYIIRHSTGAFLLKTNSLGENVITADRSRAQRFATLEEARAVFRTLPPAGRFLIVPAEEDRK